MRHFFSIGSERALNRFKAACYRQAVEFFFIKRGDIWFAASESMPRIRNWEEIKKFRIEEVKSA